MIFDPIDFIVALDPEIPPKQQRVVFKTTIAVGRGWQWRLDNQPPVSAERPAPWFPMPGRHTLVLQNERSVEVDRVAFEVRGATLKPK